jgi:hypothetical protein
VLRRDLAAVRGNCDISSHLPCLLAHGHSPPSHTSLVSLLQMPQPPEASSVSSWPQDYLTLPDSLDFCPPRGLTNTEVDSANEVSDDRLKHFTP